MVAVYMGAMTDYPYESFVYVGNRTMLYAATDYSRLLIATCSETLNWQNDFQHTVTLAQIGFVTSGALTVFSAK